MGGTIKGVAGKFYFKNEEEMLTASKYESVNDIPVTTIKGKKYEKLTIMFANSVQYLIKNKFF